MRTIDEKIKSLGLPTDTLMKASELKDSCDFISTGIKDLDRITGGGIPVGRLVEVWGAESSGKTSIAYQIITEYQKNGQSAALIDLELSFEPKRAKLFGVDTKNLTIGRPDNGEKALDLVRKLMDKNYGIIIIDSLSSLVPQNSLDIVALDSNVQPAGIARLLSKALPILLMKAHKTDTTILFINQVRADFKGVSFIKTFERNGGHQFKHLLSLSIQVQRRGKIKHNKDIYGIISRARVIKSKVSQPELDCEIALVFNRGFYSVSGAKYKEVAKEEHAKNRHKKK